MLYIGTRHYNINLIASYDKKKLSLSGSKVKCYIRNLREHCVRSKQLALFSLWRYDSQNGICASFNSKWVLLFSHNNLCITLKCLISQVLYLYIIYTKCVHIQNLCIDQKKI